MAKMSIQSIWARAVFLLPAPSYTFMSGIATGVAVNQLTATAPHNEGYYTLLGHGAFSAAQVSVGAALSLLAIGVGIFVLGVVCEQATRKADFARSDHTTQSEYEVVATSSLISRTPVTMAAAIAILVFVATAWNGLSALR